MCRQTAFFVTPSTVWPESAEQKQAIVEGYRAKLASIDCMHFDKGRGEGCARGDWAGHRRAGVFQACVRGLSGRHGVQFGVHRTGPPLH